MTLFGQYYARSGHTASELLYDHTYQLHSLRGGGFLTIKVTGVCGKLFCTRSCPKKSKGSEHSSSCTEILNANLTRYRVSNPFSFYVSIYTSARIRELGDLLGSLSNMTKTAQNQMLSFKITQYGTVKVTITSLVNTLFVLMCRKMCRNENPFYYRLNNYLGKFLFPHIVHDIQSSHCDLNYM